MPTGSVREGYVVPNRSTGRAACDWGELARSHGAIISPRLPAQEAPSREGAGVSGGILAGLRIKPKEAPAKLIDPDLTS